MARGNGKPKRPRAGQKSRTRGATTKRKPRPAAIGGDRRRPPKMEKGTSEWMALDESVRRVESAYNLKFDSIHRKLDRRGLRGQPFKKVLEAVVEWTSVPEFYAWMIVRSYPGVETDDPEAGRLRAYLRTRRSES